MGNHHISNMTLSEVHLLIDWAADEGWNPGLDDAAAFHATDPKGFHMLYANKVPAAGISVVRQDDAHAFLGLYICQPEFRGQGLGYQLWQHAIDTVQDRTVALDGVIEQQSNYQKSGFEFAWRNIRYSGAVSSTFADLPTGHTVRPVAEKDVSALQAMDTRAGGLSRPAFLAPWLSSTPNRRSMLLETAEGIVAFATIRQCREHFKIGPLLCDNDEQALGLIQALVVESGAEHIIIDVPESNDSACRLASQIGLLPVFETARMYRGPAPASDLKRLFGVATLELG